ncbi:importin-alpha export receptor, variant 2 [Puccinia graminis f. sp. tritici]|nr:importin-alpha export receptor, variant 2 [Puccinia graminis f. sp. tritici]
MIQIYYDLNCQDIPEYFEDHLEEFMNLLHKYLTWEIPYLASARQEDADDEEEGEAGELEKIRAGICEVVELYSLRYLDVFPMMDVFVKTCWDMLTRLGRQQRSDILVSKATRFLSVVVKMPSQRALFESLETLEAICEKIVLPNMFLRNFEVEMFEDDSAEFVRRDLEGSDNDTRRQAAIEITRALIEQFQKEVTAIITRYVQNYLQQYAADPTGNWRLKDAAVSLLASIASRSSTTAGGVTNTNALVDVVLFFSEQVVQDLSVKNSAPPHPIIVADAIKFLHTFRNQLTREQLISVMPLLVPHLNSEVSVIYTYAAITVERILFMKRNNQLLFSSTDLKDLAPELLTGLFAQIRKGTTPQQIAQNEMLMKCVMRVIVTAQKALLPHCEVILSNLIMILTEISKNPSNPKFNHYTFESISALIRFMTMADTRTLPIFEQALFPIFSQILTQDVQDFSPFVFQILSQMLELHTNHSEPLSDYYNDLLPPLLTPTLWELRGNVPALVRLLRAYLSAGAPRIVAENRISAMLGVFQKLIGSKLNDVYGFELLEALFEHVPVDALLPYLRNVFLLLLTRLQQSKTDKFTSAFLYTIMFIVTLEKPQLSPDLLINTINAVQPGLFSQVMEGVLLPAVASTPPKQRRVVALGHISLLTRARTLQCEAESRLYLPVLISVLRLFTLPQLKPTEDTAGENSELNVTDLEEHGYQVGFSRLGASETIGKRDPFSAMVDPRDALASGLVKAGEAQPGKIPALISQVPSEFATPYLQWLAAAGYQIK